MLNYVEDSDLVGASPASRVAVSTVEQLAVPASDNRQLVKQGRVPGTDARRNPRSNITCDSMGILQTDAMRLVTLMVHHWRLWNRV